MSEPLEIAENWAYQVWERGDLEFAERLCADNYFDAAVPEHPAGDSASFREVVANIRAAFPDLKVEVQDSFQDQDFVILRLLFKGTHVGDYEGFAPTRKPLEWESIEILHFRDEALIERFSQNDLLQVLEEIGEDFGAMQQGIQESDLIGRLAEVPRQVREAIRVNGIHPAQAGQWSTRAILGHLWRAERQVWQAQLQLLLTQDKPTLDWQEPEPDELAAEFEGSDVNVLLDAFEFLRGETCRYVRELSEEDWGKTAYSPVYGDLDVLGFLEKAYEHDQEHLIPLTGARI